MTGKDEHSNGNEIPFYGDGILNFGGGDLIKGDLGPELITEDIPSFAEWNKNTLIDRLSEAYDELLVASNLNPLLYRPQVDFKDKEGDDNITVTITAVEINPVNHLPFSDD